MTHPQCNCPQCSNPGFSVLAMEEHYGRTQKNITSKALITMFLNKTLFRIIFYSIPFIHFVLITGMFVLIFNLKIISVPNVWLLSNISLSFLISILIYSYVCFSVFSLVQKAHSLVKKTDILRERFYALNYCDICQKIYDKDNQYSYDGKGISQAIGVNEFFPDLEY